MLTPIGHKIKNTLSLNRFFIFGNGFFLVVEITVYMKQNQLSKENKQFTILIVLSRIFKTVVTIDGDHSLGTSWPTLASTLYSTLPPFPLSFCISLLYTSSDRSIHTYINKFCNMTLKYKYNKMNIKIHLHDAKIRFLL
jgi:hypothetical protein